MLPPPSAFNGCRTRFCAVLYDTVSMPNPAPTALIAEDEPLLAQELQHNLARLWPELQIVASVGDGLSAVQKALALQPDVIFMDIQMPGQSGLDAAMALIDEWPQPNLAAPTPLAHKPLPQLVFVTAYDHYAVKAFEAQAVDYLLKPVNLSKLTITIKRLIASSRKRDNLDIYFESYLNVFKSLNYYKSGADQTPTLPKLKTLQVSVGHGAAQQIKFIAVDDVLLLEAADKYLQVFTAQGDYLLRTPLKELLPQLSEDDFWQIHRGTVVRASCIESVSRDEAGKQWLCLRGHKGKVAVSRLWAHRFRAM